MTYRPLGGLGSLIKPIHASVRLPHTRPKVTHADGENRSCSAREILPIGKRPGHREGAVAAVRYAAIAAALLVVLPMLIFAGGIMVAGLGHTAVRTVLTAGLIMLALVACALVLALLALIAAGMQHVLGSRRRQERVLTNTRHDDRMRTDTSRRR